MEKREPPKKQGNATVKVAISRFQQPLRWTGIFHLPTYSKQTKLCSMHSVSSRLLARFFLYFPARHEFFTCVFHRCGESECDLHGFNKLKLLRTVSYSHGLLIAPKSKLKLLAREFGMWILSTQIAFKHFHCSREAMDF